MFQFNRKYYFYENKTIINQFLPNSSTNLIMTPPTCKSLWTRMVLSTCKSVTRILNSHDPSIIEARCPFVPFVPMIFFFKLKIFSSKHKKSELTCCHFTEKSVTKFEFLKHWRKGLSINPFQILNTFNSSPW